MEPSFDQQIPRHTQEGDSNEERQTDDGRKHHGKGKGTADDAEQGCRQAKQMNDRALFGLDPHLRYPGCEVRPFFLAQHFDCPGGDLARQGDARWSGCKLCLQKLFRFWGSELVEQPHGASKPKHFVTRHQAVGYDAEAMGHCTDVFDVRGGKELDVGYRLYNKKGASRCQEHGACRGGDTEIHGHEVLGEGRELVCVYCFLPVGTTSAHKKGIKAA